MSKPDGGLDTWTYSYPDLNAQEHIVTVIDPKQHKRNVKFKGYTDDLNVWSVGNLLSDETLQFDSGNYTSIKKFDFIYAANTVSSSPIDLETCGQIGIKVPVMTSKVITYPQTTDQATTTYSGYDRFGNVGEIDEKDFGGLIFRKTQYQYEHSNGDGHDTEFEDNNFIRAITLERVVNGSDQLASQIVYEYNHDLNDDGNFGLLSKSKVWDDKLGTDIEKDFYHNEFPVNMRHLNQITEVNPGGTDRHTHFNNSCNIIDLVYDDLPQAGDIFAAQVWPNGNDYYWVYKETYSPNGHITSYDYDDNQRLKSITPPSGDIININYDDSTRSVTVNQGSASTTETYDANARLEKRQISIDTNNTSTQTFVYDAFNNVITEYEKSLLSNPTTPITRTYDAFNRVKSVTTADGTVKYNYIGPNLDIVQDKEGGGTLTTTLKYDAGGRLISVTEPNLTLTKTTYTYDAMDRLTMVCHNDNDAVCDTNTTLRRTFEYSTRSKLMSETHPEFRQSNGTDFDKITYVYDILGRMTQKTLPGLPTVTYSYDLRDRVTNINYSNDPDVFYYYDGAAVPGYTSEVYTYPKSHLTGMIDGSGTTLWTQFSIDEAVEKKKTIFDTGFPQNVEYQYDSRGNLDSIIYPSGNKALIPRNNANAISEIKRSYNGGPESFLLDEINYNAALLPRLLDFANGVNYTITEDVRNRPSLMSSAGQLSLAYTYNVRSLISKITTSQNGSPNQDRNIEYDALGRISKFTHAGNPDLNYSFDIYGNLLSKTGALVEGPYTYGNNRIDGISYTQAGSQLTANGKTLAYNQANQLKVVTGALSTTYNYDGIGNRAKVTDTGGNRRFIYDESGNILAEIKKEAQSFVEKEYIDGPSGTLVTANYEEQRAQFNENFNDGIADFTVSLGNWAVVGQAYNAQATGSNWAISNACITCTNCVIKADAQSVNQTGNKNAFIIFDFVNNSNFKYAGFDVTTHKWVIGDVVSGTRTDRAFSTTSPPAAGTSYSLEVKFIGNAVYLKIGGITRVVYAFASIAASRFALGVQGAQSNFDNVSTTLAYSKSFVHQENFDDGVANGYTVVSGAWSVISQKYQTSGPAAANISRAPVSGFNTGLIEMDCQFVSNGICRILFDYTNSTNFKFAGINTSLNRWELGQVVNGTTTFLSTLTGANGNINYHFKLLLENSSTATLIYNNAIKVQGTYSANFSTGLVALFANSPGYKFDNVEVYTDGAGVYAPDYSLGPFYYHLNDHLGSTRILTDKNGAVVASLEFYPFGEAKQSFGCSNFIDQHFTGKLLDSESGLQYFGARYLSNGLTRFTSVDPLGSSAHPKNPQSWNRYTYSLNSPLNLLDPDGKKSKSFEGVQIIWTKLKHVLKGHGKHGEGSQFVNPNPKAIKKDIQRTVKEENLVEVQRLKGDTDAIKPGRKMYKDTYEKGDREVEVTVITEPVSKNKERLITAWSEYIKDAVIPLWYTLLEVGAEKTNEAAGEHVERPVREGMERNREESQVGQDGEERQ